MYDPEWRPLGRLGSHALDLPHHLFNLGGLLEVAEIGADLAHVRGVCPEVVHHVVARQLHQRLAIAGLAELANLKEGCEVNVMWFGNNIPASQNILL